MMCECCGNYTNRTYKGDYTCIDCIPNPVLYNIVDYKTAFDKAWKKLAYQGKSKKWLRRRSKRAIISFDILVSIAIKPLDVSQSTFNQIKKAGCKVK